MKAQADCCITEVAATAKCAVGLIAFDSVVQCITLLGMRQTKQRTDNNNVVLSPVHVLPSSLFSCLH